MKKAFLSVLIVVNLLIFGSMQAAWDDVMHLKSITNETPYNVTITNKENNYRVAVAANDSVAVDPHRMFAPWYWQGAEDKNFIFIDFPREVNVAGGSNRLKVSDHGSPLVAGILILDAHNNILKKITLDRGNTYNMVLNYLGEETADGVLIDVDFNLLERSDLQKLVKGVVKGVEDTVEGAAKFISATVQGLAAPIKEHVKRDQVAIQNNPYKNVVARVRQGSVVAPGEIVFRQARWQKIKAAQEKLLGIKLNEDEEPLEISFVFSGGGWRALAISAGTAAGAEKIGLLDAVMYVSGLSGSTWFLSPWLIGDPENDNEPLSAQEYEKTLLPRLVQGLPKDIGLKLGPDEVKAIMDAILVKFAFDQPVNIIDFYGAFIANNLLQHYGDDRQRVYISKQAEKIKTGNWPMPINTAVLGMRDQDALWYEVTPFEIGSRWLGSRGGMYIPTWSFGRRFNNGVSIDFAPEQSMGFFMGIFGSAIAATFKDAYEQVIQEMSIPDVIKNIFLAAARTELGEMRLFWGEAYNFVRGIEGSPLRNEEKIKLVDAGLDFMDPVFDTYRKTVSPDSDRIDDDGAPDVLFIVDAGASAGSSDLYLQAQYAENHNLKYPIKTTDFRQDIEKNWVFKDESLQVSVTQRAMTVFEDEHDMSVPLVIYMPRITDPELAAEYAKLDPENEHELETFDVNECVTKGHCGTFNLEYTHDQAAQLLAVGSHNIQALEAHIKDILRKRIAAKRSQPQEPDTTIPSSAEAVEMQKIIDKLKSGELDISQAEQQTSTILRSIVATPKTVSIKKVKPKKSKRKISEKRKKRLAKAKKTQVDRSKKVKKKRAKKKHKRSY